MDTTVLRPDPLEDGISFAHVELNVSGFRGDEICKELTNHAKIEAGESCYPMKENDGSLRWAESDRCGASDHSRGFSLRGQSR